MLNKFQIVDLFNVQSCRYVDSNGNKICLPITLHIIFNIVCCIRNQFTMEFYVPKTISQCNGLTVYWIWFCRERENGGTAVIRSEFSCIFQMLWRCIYHSALNIEHEMENGTNNISNENWMLDDVWMDAVFELVLSNDVGLNFRQFHHGSNKCLT